MRQDGQLNTINDDKMANFPRDICAAALDAQAHSPPLRFLVVRWHGVGLCDAYSVQHMCNCGTPAHASTVERALPRFHHARDAHSKSFSLKRCRRGAAEQKGNVCEAASCLESYSLENLKGPCAAFGKGGAYSVCGASGGAGVVLSERELCAHRGWCQEKY